MNDSILQTSNFIKDIIEKDKTNNHDLTIMTRFPPEPNGYLHIGHAKSICINFGIAEQYKGNCNLRFDDTNPLKENSEYVNSIINDVKWLEFNWDKTPLQSRKCYMGKFKPSQKLNEWHPNFPIKYLKCDPDRKDSNSGYENFTIVKLVVQTIDLLELHPDGHIRFSINSDGKINFIAP